MLLQVATSPCLNDMLAPDIAAGMVDYFGPSLGPGLCMACLGYVTRHVGSLIDPSIASGGGECWPTTTMGPVLAWLIGGVLLVCEIQKLPT